MQRARGLLRWEAWTRSAGAGTSERFGALGCRGAGQRACGGDARGCRGGAACPISTGVRVAACPISMRGAGRLTAPSTRAARARTPASPSNSARTCPRRRGAVRARQDASARGHPLRPAPPPRTKWTRRVPHPVLIGHAAAHAPQVPATDRSGGRVRLRVLASAARPQAARTPRAPMARRAAPPRPRARTAARTTTRREASSASASSVPRAHLPRDAACPISAG